MKRVLLLVYDRFVLLYYKVFEFITQKKVTVSIGDLLLNRGVVDISQFLVASRLLDIEAYCKQGNKSFTIQKATTNNPLYDEAKYNAAFIDVIESYLKNGYNGKSLFLLDKEKFLRNGTHRTAMHVYMGIYTAKAKVVNRKWPEFDAGYEKQKNTLSKDVYDAISVRLTDIEKQLIENGVTFNAVIPADMLLTDIFQSIKDDLHVFKEILLNRQKNEQNEKLVLFRIDNPQYVIVKGLLQSKKITDAIEQDRANGLMVSFSCYEGKQMYDALHPYFINN